MSHADSATLIRLGESWRYLKVPMNGPAPEVDWRAPGFDETTWRSATSGFVLPDPEEPVSPRLRATSTPGYTYVRKRFQVNDPRSIRSLVLQVEHERGFVAYLNGVEIARHSGRGVHYPTAAEQASGVEDPIVYPVVRDLSAQRSLLVAGENVLALEGSVTGESLSPFTLAAMLTANFTRGPFVQNASTNRMQILWRTAGPGTSFVEYGLTPSLGRRVADGEMTTNHIITLSGLEPDTRYYYRAGTFDGIETFRSEIESFRTLKMAGPITFVVMGDTGQASPQQFLIADVVRRANPDLVLHAGDIIYGGFTDANADARYFNIYQQHIKNTPYFLAIGNHDLGCCEIPADFNLTNWVLNATAFQSAYALPTNDVTGTEHFYSFDHGDAHFVAIYNPWFAHYKFTNGTDQMMWLSNDLARTTKPWKFCFMHMPLANSGLHWFRDDNQNGIADNAELMDLLLPVCERYGVQFVFGGHDHNFERFAPTNGLHHIVTGGGGGNNASYGLRSRHLASAQFWLTYHCTKVTLSGDTLSLEALNTDGEVFDTLVVHRSLLPDQIYDSTWNTPTIEPTPGDDGQGNITGQTFDLAGPALPARAGRSANLGRFYINNDSTHLYVGIQNPMYYGNQNLFVLIESPRQTGVRTMAGLGNGIVDPDGEGADGLDFLENLSFTNFTPSVACVLGDEMADQSARSFVRGNLGLNIGQGVFRLEAGLGTVPSARLQQFSRSPQPAPDLVPGNPNADLIEVAIPFAALGDARPGDVIQIAAVVGGGNYDPGTQTREIDTSALATVMLGSGLSLGPVVLGGVRVRLATLPNMDSDGDGLLDAWERQFGLNPNSAAGDDGASGDPDRDGFSNAQEQIAGTDPRDARSVLRLSLTPLPAQRYQVTWRAVPGRRYHLEFANDQVTNYTGFAGPGWPRVALTPEESFVDELPVNAPPRSLRAYRVRLVP